MLTASGLSRSFGSRTLFAAVSLHLGSGRRVALGGSPGTGTPARSAAPSSLTLAASQAALEPFTCSTSAGEQKDPTPLPYLQV